jgi:hypothetical protein
MLYSFHLLYDSPSLSNICLFTHTMCYWAPSTQLYPQTTIVLFINGHHVNIIAWNWHSTKCPKPEMYVPLHWKEHLTYSLIHSSSIFPMLIKTARHNSTFTCSAFKSGCCHLYNKYSFILRIFIHITDVHITVRFDRVTILPLLVAMTHTRTPTPASPRRFLPADRGLIFRVISKGRHTFRTLIHACPIIGKMSNLQS